MQESIVYKDGEYIAESEAQVSFRDLGLQRGFGVFAYIRIYGRKFFQPEWHANQLTLSLQGLRIPLDMSSDFYINILKELIVKNEHFLKPDRDYAIKTMVTGGVHEPLLIIYIEELDLSDYINLTKKGAGLLVHKGQRLYPEIKSLDYRAQYLNTDILREKKCLEILYVNNNTVFEAATSNVFIIKDDEIITPSESIYKGSTREFVIEFARDYGYKVKEQEISWSDFITADEVFITASKKEVMPITHVHDGDRIHLFGIGPVTKNLINIFKDKKQNL